MTDKSELRGLGGWLLLVGFGIVVSPIRLIATFVPAYKSIFEDGTWASLTTVGSDAYNPYFGYLLIGEIVFNTLLVVASIYLIYLFFSKHYIFPKLFIAIVTIPLIFIPLDAWIVTKIFPEEEMFDPDTIFEFVRSLITCVIWVPYMLVSKRVRATFVEKMPNKKIQPPAESVI